MVLLRLLRWLIWPRREREPEEAYPRRRRRNPPRRRPHQPGVYRIEVDGEAHRFHGDGPPFSFWSSSRVILILSFLLWWIQPAGPMIAGYVGGRRAGSPMKAVIAALLPVFAIYLANASYAASVASRQIDVVASLPTIVGDALASILPFLVPYREFLVSYMAGFVSALTTTFGMGTNGYLMVVIFAYIGGLIAEQTRRELFSRSGAGSSSFGVNLVQPLVGARPYVDDEEEAYEEDEEIHRSRRPVRSRARRHPAVVGLEPRRRRDRGAHFESYRSLSALAEDEHGHRTTHRRHRPGDDEQDEDDEGEEVIVTRVHRVSRDRSEDEPEHRRTTHHHVKVEDEEEAPEEPPSRSVRTRSQAEERAIQRFVERALRNYDHSKL
jgi:hypothetical protein